ncbi:LacI family DNA-binding transcriptional regulator [Planomicrobium sp. CPCC 101110]|uniref:LacI family DNA-binding transcriptional regulator n=1 Tax=Planomicrobium sp. CPCC 101110 TaxID=2599619 RepID=UPI0011B3630A|nr:LacI family DNA-binding transcriptional regulator [Planomicrobium sp. CPCC 101110]TWT27267.1 LacI family transcriptional regulator [Planomicrobium sp. CPCC 101110]
MAPTIYDIARAANVSKSTVSRVLNNQQNISEEARERVLNAIKDLNYHPNKLARSLSTGFDAILVISRSSATIVDNPFFSEILNSISRKAEEEHFDVILQTSQNNQDELKKCIKKIREKMIKGIIILSSPTNEKLLQQLDVFGIPAVVIGKVTGDYTNIFSVDTDNYRDSYAQTQFLIDQGHEKIACLHSPFDYNVAIDRFNGYRDCMEANGLKPKKQWIRNSGYTIGEAYKAAKGLLELSDRPTAVFATDDLKVISVYRAFTEENVRIPADMSVIGFSNSNLSQFLFPSLTSMEIPIRQLGETGTELLFSKIKGSAATPAKVILPTENIKGASVAAVTG